MTKQNKLLTDTRTLFKGFTYGALCCGIISLVAITAAGSERPEATPDQLETSRLTRPIDSISETLEDIYADNLSPSQLQADINHHIGFSPDFALDADALDVEENEEDDAEETVGHSIDEEEQHDLLTAYLDGLLMQQQKYNRYIQTLTNDLQYAEMHDEDYLMSPEPIENWAHPLLDTLHTITTETPLFIHGNDGTFRMFVDYDLVERHYEELLSPFHVNLMRLHKDIARFGYNREDGRVDADILYHRLLLIDEIQENDRSKDGFYWEEERFQLVSLFVGYGADTRPTWDDERIQQLESIAGYDVHNPYCDIALALLESIENEGEYGPDTVRLVNDWMTKEFSDYLTYLESTQN